MWSWRAFELPYLVTACCLAAMGARSRSCLLYILALFSIEVDRLNHLVSSADLVMYLRSLPLFGDFLRPGTHGWISRYSWANESAMGFEWRGSLQD